MTDIEQTAKEDFVRTFERNERLSVAVTVIWLVVAALMISLIFAIVPY